MVTAGPPRWKTRAPVVAARAAATKTFAVSGANCSCVRPPNAISLSSLRAACGHRDARRGRQSVVASRTVDDERADADRRHLFLLPEDPCKPLARLLVHPVERRRMADGLVRHRRPGVVDTRVGGCRARVGDANVARLGGVEHVDGPADVHRRPVGRISLDLRDQQRCQVHDVRDRMLVEHGVESRTVGDVAADDPHVRGRPRVRAGARSSRGRSRPRRRPRPRARRTSRRRCSRARP